MKQMSELLRIILTKEHSVLEPFPILYYFINSSFINYQNKIFIFIVTSMVIAFFYYLIAFDNLVFQ